MDNIISEATFYGGDIKCLLDPISIDSLDNILDLLDEYIELVESTTEWKE